MRLAASPEGLRKLTRGRRRGGERGEEESLWHKQEANKPGRLLIGGRITEETCIKVVMAAAAVLAYGSLNTRILFLFFKFRTPVNLCQRVHKPCCVFGWIPTDPASHRFNILNGTCILKSWSPIKTNSMNLFLERATKVFFHGGTKREILLPVMLKHQFGREWRQC